MLGTGRGLLLTIDVGNTNVKLGVWRGEELVETWRLETDPQRVSDEYAVSLSVLLSSRGLSFADIGAVSLSSTVPALVPTLRDLARRYLPPDCTFVEVTSEANTGVTLAIDNPREAGADRIVDALAAARLYRLPAVIVDFGTATTFDAVDADGRLLGTALAPGFRTAMDGLFARAARLSRIEVERPKRAIGTNTVDALRSGWVYGYVGLVEGLVRRICAELGGQPTIIATGGLAEEVVAETTIFDVYDPLLTLKGLRLFYELNKPQEVPA